jgi:hypothetical protein
VWLLAGGAASGIDKSQPNKASSIIVAYGFVFEQQ